MTTQTDIAALVEALRVEAKEWRETIGEMPLFDRAADALESTAAELRQERERADTWWKAALTVEGDLFQARARTEAMRIDRDHYRQVSRELAAELARAREVIASAREAVEHTLHPEQLPTRCGVCRVERILATYEKGQQS